MNITTKNIIFDLQFPKLAIIMILIGHTLYHFVKGELLYEGYPAGIYYIYDRG